MRFEVVGIALENVLRFNHCVADAARLGIKFSQARREIFRARVRFDRGPIFLNRFVGQIAAPINRNLLFVHVSESVVIVGGCLICLARGSWGRLFRLRGNGGGLAETGSRSHQKHRKSYKKSLHEIP